ncbi:MAG: class I SAM-dependent methyltransferase [Gammaproteobacteria bacterium]|nr:class I SAM-dependent methyltransferase [Gammaproteobacteria bacterium]
MPRLVLSSSARILDETADGYLIFNGINVRLQVPGSTVDLLREFTQPQDPAMVLARAGAPGTWPGALADLKQHLFLVPAEVDHLVDMRAAWNCLAQGTDDDAAYVIDNETRTVEEFSVSGAEAVAALDAIVAIQPSWHLVNIGCGMGRLERHLASRVRRIVAFDVSDLMLQRASAYLAGCPNVDLRRTDSDLDGVADSSIDLVISFLAFQHCPKEITWRYFHEARRVLAPDGRFLFQILCYSGLDGYQAGDRSPVERYYGRGKARYEEDEVKTELLKAGFRVDILRDGMPGIERRLTGTSAPHWRSKLVYCR